MNKEKYNINLDNVPVGIITLDGIKEHSIDKDAVLAERLSWLKAAFSETDYKIIKCGEYLLAGLDMPYEVAALHRERQELRDEINKAG